MTLANSLNEASDGASLLREDTALREMAQSLPGLTTLTGNSIILCINQLFRMPRLLLQSFPRAPLQQSEPVHSRKMLT